MLMTYEALTRLQKRSLINLVAPFSFRGGHETPNQKPHCTAGAGAAAAAAAGARP